MSPSAGRAVDVIASGSHAKGASSQSARSARYRPIRAAHKLASDAATSTRLPSSTRTPRVFHFDTELRETPCARAKSAMLTRASVTRRVRQPVGLSTRISHDDAAKPSRFAIPVMRERAGRDPKIRDRQGDRLAPSSRPKVRGGRGCGLQAWRRPAPSCKVLAMVGRVAQPPPTGCWHALASSERCRALPLHGIDRERRSREIEGRCGDAPQRAGFGVARA